MWKQLLLLWVKIAKTHTTSPIPYKAQSTVSSTLTAHKVSDVVFQAKPRTKSFRWTGSELATLLISSAIEGYWDPLHATTCKQAHMHSINSHSIHVGSNIIWAPFTWPRTKFSYIIWTKPILTHKHKCRHVNMHTCKYVHMLVKHVNINNTGKHTVRQKHIHRHIHAAHTHYISLWVFWNAWAYTLNKDKGKQSYGTVTGHALTCEFFILHKLEACCVHNLQTSHKANVLKLIVYTSPNRIINFTL